MSWVRIKSSWRSRFYHQMTIFFRLPSKNPNISQSAFGRQTWQTWFPQNLFFFGFPFKWWDNIPWWMSSIQEFASVTGSYRLTGFLSVLCRCCPTWSMQRHSCVSDAGATEDLLEETKPGWGFILSHLSLTPQSLIENLVCKFANFTVTYCGLCWYKVSVLYWGSL